MALGLDFLPTDRFILTERCDGSCIKPDWTWTRRPRDARHPVLLLIYAFFDRSGRRQRQHWSTASRSCRTSIQLQVEPCNTAITMECFRAHIIIPLQRHLMRDHRCIHFEQRTHTFSGRMRWGDRIDEEGLAPSKGTAQVLGPAYTL